jgi:hypothetical protein
MRFAVGCVNLSFGTKNHGDTNEENLGEAAREKDQRK